jgi:hypothetical protein
LSPRITSWALFTTSLFIASILACSSSDTTPKTLTTTGKDAGNVGDDTSEAGPVDPPPIDGGPAAGRVYAHTTDTLFVFEPFSRKLTEIGKFNCLQDGEAVIDIALDRTNEMYATTFTRFLHVDATSGACTERGVATTLDYPNSLSFVPIGTVDPTQEALVGFASADGVDSDLYVRIDINTGAMTTIGRLNPVTSLMLYSSSGDLISLLRDSNKTYLTVRDRTIDSGVALDKLAEIDPKTGEIMRIIGDTKQGQIYGLGYWAGKAYGFSADGRITEIDVTNGSSTVLLTHTVDGGAVPWYGAGVTTNAPISP